MFQDNDAINNVKAFAQIIKAYFIYIFSEYNFIYVSTGDEKCLVTFLTYVSSGDKKCRVPKQ